MKIKTKLIFLGFKILKQENKPNEKQSKQDKNKVKRLSVWDSPCYSSNVPGNGARKLLDDGYWSPENLLDYCWQNWVVPQAKAEM